MDRKKFLLMKLRALQRARRAIDKHQQAMAPAQPQPQAPDQQQPAQDPMMQEVPTNAPQ